MSPIAAPEAGTDRFAIGRRLGAGGMGAVHEAFDRRHGARVALKRLHAANAEARLTLKREFRTLADLRHRNLVSLLELVEEGGELFFTMELLDGVDFLQFVRPGGTEVPVSGFTETAPTGDLGSPQGRLPAGASAPDEARLRDALGQLAEGLAALHGAGKVHRDIKPSNVLVTAEGRVVLLDFGLAADDETPRRPGVAGTRSFMAPEQATGHRVAAAADWYAVGVMMHLALTGELPYRGADAARKRAHELRPSVRERAPDAPLDLAALCEDLLALDPSARPSHVDVLARLGRRVTTTALATPDFVGRAPELRALHDDFHARRTTLVLGDSGVGKSALVREALARVRQAAPDAVVLRSRCYERELVAYSAFDGIVDELARFLRDEPRFVPPDATILARVFPSLATVPAFAAPSPLEEGGPPVLRARAFTALRAILLAVAEARPLVLAIDDLQWLDADSAVLLRELLAPPRPAFFLVATARTVSSATEALGPSTRALSIEPLTPDESRQLVSEALAGSDPAAVEALVREGGGHPLFLLALASRAEHAGAPGAVSLEDAIWSRVEALSPRERALLELAAVAGAPIDDAPGRMAAAMDHAAYSAAADALRVGRMTRNAGGPGEHRLEAYHDRIRGTVLGRLTATRKRAWHARLADAIEATGCADGDRQIVVQHLLGAGETARAAQHAERAAAHALHTLAFDRAAELYAIALRHGDGDARRSKALRVALAETLASGGRGTEAGEAHLACLEDADADARLDHRNQAAGHFLRSGHLERGLATLSDVLAELGEALPATTTRALLALIGPRLLNAVRGLDWEPRAKDDVPRDVLRRLDVYHSVSAALCLVDTARGAVFQAKSVALALGVGEPLRLGRSLTLEACYTGSTGASGLERGERLLAEVAKIARMTGDPYLRACTFMARGFLDYHGGAFRSAEAAFVEGERRYRDETRGSYFEGGFCHWFRLNALRHRGMWSELSRGFEGWIRSAERRDDRFMEAAIRLNLNAIWLVRDRPDEALRDLERTRWSPPEGGYHLQHWYVESARAEIGLYAGDAKAALARFRPFMKALGRTLIPRMRIHRATMHWTLARLLLASGGPLPAIERLARRLRDERIGFATVWADLTWAAVLHRRGQRAGAEEALERAASTAERFDLPQYAAAARHRLGHAGARTWFADQGILDPGRMTLLWAPEL